MFPKLFTYHMVSISDESTENIGRHFNSVSKFIKTVIRRDSANVLINCMTGNNLAACFVAAYLVKYHDYGVQQALKVIKR